MTRKPPRSTTEGFSKSDTLVGKSAESDTRLGRTPASWGLPKTLPPAQRQKIGRMVAGLVTVAAVAAIGWLAWEATGRRESVQDAREARGHALQVAAGFAASEILKEIRQRFDILNRLATEDELQQLMNQILRSPNDETNWTRLENWLGARKADHDREVPCGQLVYQRRARRAGGPQPAQPRQPRVQLRAPRLFPRSGDGPGGEHAQSTTDHGRRIYRPCIAALRRDI